jgi:peptidoglycan/xylan/chitin deacetylase (PgdA/CDA1 family)
MKKWGCLTLDLEEDNGGISKNVTYESLEIFPELVGRLAEAGAPLTIFVAGNFLENQGERLRPFLSQEFHSHGYWHPPLGEANNPGVRRENIRKGIAAFKTYCGRDSVGYRAPYGYLEASDFELLAEQGVRFDASFFPGVHVSGFHFFRSDRPFVDRKTGIVEIPMSAFPLLRFPYSFSYLNLVGRRFFQWPLRRGWARSPFVFDFHLHDLESSLGGENLSFVWKLIYRQKNFSDSWEKMRELIQSFQDAGGTFTTLGQLHNDMAKDPTR